MAGIWYRTGTITLTQGSQVVSGVGTTFASNVRVGDMLIGPLMDLYEITDVIADSQVRIDRNYEAASYTGTDWSIAPTSAQLKQLAKQISDLIVIYQDIPEAAAGALAAVTNAQVAASQAGVSAAAALTSEQTGATWKSQAAGSATAASNSASAAAGSAITASTKAGEAAASATQALGYRNESQAIKDSLTAAAVTSVAGRTGAVTLAKGDVGLSNVDNTSDASKPVSSAQATAIANLQSQITGQIGPRFRAARPTAQTIANNTVVVAQLATETFDPSNAFNNATYRFQPAVAGYYLFTWAIGISNAGASTLSRAVGLLQKNGAERSRSAFASTATHTVMTLSGSDIIYLNGTTDYVDLAGFGTVSSGTLSIDGTSGSSDQTFLAGHYIGP